MMNNRITGIYDPLALVKVTMRYLHQDLAALISENVAYTSCSLFVSGLRRYAQE